MKAASSVAVAGRVFDVEVLNLPAPGKDQDAWRLADDFVAVADGATPLGDQPPSAVRGYARAALDALEAQRTKAVRTMVWAAVEATRPLATRNSPPLSCTVALARTVGGAIEVAVLGDCTVVVAYEEGRRRTIRDPRLSRVDAGVIGKLADLTRSGVSAEAARLAIAEDLTSNCMRMNTPETYWSFSGERIASRHVLHRLLVPQSVAAMLLCSDGFSRLADTFHATAGMTGLLDRCRNEGLVALGEELRNLELAPDSLIRYPRFGRHDDATAILLTASETPPAQ